tara:strand:- start:2661 stop:3446 length:786 start_codon:yes stop_codon:yes gene_type:complete
MSSTTNIKFQYELEALLADNTAKQISAQDVRTIVTSNYQPVLIFAGRLYSDNNTSIGFDFMRTQYYNFNYFGSDSIMSPGGNNPWVIDNVGSGIVNGVHENVALVQNAWDSQNMAAIGGDSTNATFDITVTNSVVTSATLKQAGVGWIGKNTINTSTTNGQTGQLNINGNTSASLKFNGPLVKYYEAGGVAGFDMSFNSVNQNHTILNTILSATANSVDNNNGVDITLATVPSNFRTPENNKLAIDHHDNGAYIQIWRVAQ